LTAQFRLYISGNDRGDIANAAGISSGSVFYYFPDKRAVFRAVFERDLPLSRELVARYAPAGDVMAAILDLAGELAADARDPGAFGLVVELLRQVDHDPDRRRVRRRPGACRPRSRRR